MPPATIPMPTQQTSTHPHAHAHSPAHSSSITKQLINFKPRSGPAPVQLPTAPATVMVTSTPTSLPSPASNSTIPPRSSSQPKSTVSPSFQSQSQSMPTSQFSPHPSAPVPSAPYSMSGPMMFTSYAPPMMPPPMPMQPMMSSPMYVMPSMEQQMMTPYMPVASSFQFVPMVSAADSTPKFDTDESNVKKLRRVKSPHQLKILKEFYLHNDRPNKEQLRTLVLQSRLPPHEVTRWFRNERHKDKKMNETREYHEQEERRQQLEDAVKTRTDNSTTPTSEDIAHITAWINSFHSFDSDTRRTAIERLIQIAQPSDLDILKGALKARFSDLESIASSASSMSRSTSSTSNVSEPASPTSVTNLSTANGCSTPTEATSSSSVAAAPESTIPPIHLFQQLTSHLKKRKLIEFSSSAPSSPSNSSCSSPSPSNSTSTTPCEFDQQVVLGLTSMFSSRPDYLISVAKQLGMETTKIQKTA